MVATDRNAEQDFKGLAFIKAEVRNSGRMPSIREIGRAVGYTSPRSVQLMLTRLEKRGAVRYANGIIELTADLGEAGDVTIKVPLLGSVACGMPSLAEQETGTSVRISTKIARPGGTYFLLRAKGNSMDKSGINDGDLMLIRRQSVADPGQIVVALIDYEATAKHFKPSGEHVMLLPNSTDPDNKPILVNDDLAILGVFVTVIPDIFDQP